MRAPIVTPFGAVGQVRLMVLSRGDERVMLCYWCQNSDGSVFARGVLSADLAERLRTRGDVFQTMATGHATCIVHLSTQIRQTGVNPKAPK